MVNMMKSTTNKFLGTIILFLSFVFSSTELDAQISYTYDGYDWDNNGWAVGGNGCTNSSTALIFRIPIQKYSIVFMKPPTLQLPGFEEPTLRACNQLFSLFTHPNTTI